MPDRLLPRLQSTAAAVRRRSIHEAVEFRGVVADDLFAGKAGSLGFALMRTHL
jgi:hypothetical protein